MADDQNKKKKKEELTEADIERMELLQKANEKVGKQLSIHTEKGTLEEVDELRALMGKAFEDPEEKYNIYYRGIRRLLMDYLPKGREFKEARDIIYDEKNIFLNLGKRKSDHDGIRKSDGRMTFQPVMSEILDIIIKWVAASQNPFDLYREFYELNERHGYGHEEYDKTSLSIAKSMYTLSEKDETAD